jgi:sensor histidine kinase YesM
LTVFVDLVCVHNGQIIETSEGLQTTKNNKQSHGIGLKSVSKILEKYNGDIMYTHDHNTFITDVMICNINDKDSI